MATRGRPRKDMGAAAASTIEQITGDTTANTTTEAKKEFYTFSLKMPMRYKKYLQKRIYQESDETRIITITEYLCGLIEKDMKAHGEK